MPEAGPPPETLGKEEEPKPKRTSRTRAAGPQPIRPPSAVSQRRKMQNDIAEVLTIANLFATPFARNDVLDDVEILALARAMEEQAHKSPRFKRILERALSASGGTGLVGVLIVIIGRRAARHGAIDSAWDQRLEILLRFQNEGIDPTDPAAMEQAAAVVAAAMESQPQPQPQPESVNGQSYPEQGFGTPIVPDRT